MDFGVNSYQFCQFDDIRSVKISVLSKYAHTIILYYIPYQNFTI